MNILASFVYGTPEARKMIDDFWSKHPAILLLAIGVLVVTLILWWIKENRR